MKKTLAILLIIAISSMTPYAGMQVQALAATATTAGSQQQDQEQYQEQYGDVQFSADQLENLVAPIALYPDPLLAQVLLAATFPDQIDEAARQVRAYGGGYNIDSAYWDVSVKAVAHYPAVLAMMADKLDWTTSLGQAYVNQSSDLMQAVQRLRRQARSAGYLASTAQQEIVDTGGYLSIYPAQAEYIYVPTYDPGVVFVSRPGFHVETAIWFGAGLLIGAWLNHGFDWDHHNVYYHGWESGGPQWIARSRSHVRLNNYYVNNTYRNVVSNRNVVNRSVNYGALNRYNTVHRDVNYNNVRRERAAPGARPVQAQPVPAQPSAPRQDNTIIRRNINPNDPRIDANRGRGQQPGQEQRGNVQVPRQPQVTQPQTTPPVREQRGNVQVPRQPQVTQPQTTPPVQQQRGNVQVPRQPESVFRGGSATVDPRAASQRGQFSRQQPARPAPAAQPAPRQQAPAPQRQQAPAAQPRQQAPAAQPAPRQQAPAAKPAPRQQGTPAPQKSPRGRGL